MYPQCLTDATFILYEDIVLYSCSQFFSLFLLLFLYFLGLKQRGHRFAMFELSQTLLAMYAAEAREGWTNAELRWRRQRRRQRARLAKMEDSRGDHDADEEDDEDLDDLDEVFLFFFTLQLTSVYSKIIAAVVIVFILAYVCCFLSVSEYFCEGLGRCFLDMCLPLPD